MDQLLVWIAAASGVLGLGTTVWNLLRSGSRENGKRIDALTDRVKQLETRVERHAARMEHVPTSDQMHELQISMTELKGEMATLQAKLQPIGSIVERLQEFAMQKGS